MTASTRPRLGAPRVALLVVVVLASPGCRKIRGDPAPRVELSAKKATLRQHGCELHAELVPERATIALGESTSVSFRVTTECDAKLGVGSGGDMSSSGRQGRYTLSAIDERGQPAPDAPEGEAQGGGSGYAWLERTRPFATRLPLAAYVTFPRPGRYEVTVSTHLDVVKTLPDGKREHSKDDWASTAVKVSTIVEVSP